MHWMGGPAPAACWLLLAPIAVLFSFGMIRLHFNLPVFDVWIREDGLAEWTTFAGLAALCALALARAAGAAAGPVRNAWIVLGLALFFGAAEEISWGQRVFGWYSPEWFLQHNAQQETTVHNLVVGGVKVNKLVFGKLLGFGLALYFLLLPVRYRRPGRLRAFMDHYALPVPRNYQVLLALLAWSVTEAARSILGKAGELQELGLVFVLAAVLLHPLNEAATMPSAVRLDTLLRSLAARLRAWARAWLPARLRFLLLALALLIVQFGLFRMIFAASFEPVGLDQPVADMVWDRGVPHLQVSAPAMVPASDVARAWALGARFDLRIALLLLLPIALLGWIRPLDPARSARARRGWLAYLVVAATAVFALHAVDLGHYAYEARRLDATLLDQTRETGIAAGMVWQTYPVGRILLVLGLLVAGTVRLLSRWLPAQPEQFSGTRRRRGAVITAAVLLYIFGLHGQWSQYPLRWSNAYFSPNAYLSALASNPLQTLFDSLRAPRAPVDAVAACRAQAHMAPHFGLAPCVAAPPSFARSVAPAPVAGAPPNVVVVFLESFSAYKTGIMGNPLNPSPHFDALAKSSVLYTRFYSVTRPTARSIFSSLFGIPDVAPERSASRIPGMVSQHTLVNAFAGYRKRYFIGGSASWGNVRGMLQHNLSGLDLYEGEDSDQPMDDVWGISDLHLFEAAHRALAAETQPFIAFIQTSGNHRPYTIPEDTRGFERTALPADRLLAAGFEEPDAYDGMRFIDHSLGRFLALAAQEPYYRNTIFAIYGDHGSPARRFPPYEQQLREQHVPMVLHAPRWFGDQGRVVDDVVSDIDVLPTLARLAGVAHLNTALGRDLMVERTADSQFAYMSTGEGQGLVERDFFYERDRAGHETLRRALADGSLGADDLATVDPARLKRMSELARAIHDSSAWLLLNNPPREAVPAAAPTGR